MIKNQLSYFLASKGGYDSFYRPENKILSEFVEKAKPLFEALPERSDHPVTDFKII